MEIFKHLKEKMHIIDKHMGSLSTEMAVTPKQPEENSKLEEDDI